jgi:hypothetical protein
MVDAWLLRLGRPWIVALTGSLLLLFMLVLLPQMAADTARYGQGAGSPDTAMLYTPPDLYRMAEAFGPDGRSVYVLDRATYDLGYPLAYGLFFASATVLAMRRAFPDRRRLVRLGWLGIAALVSDLLENAVVSTLMLAYPTRLPTLAWLASTFSAAKWLLVSLALLVALGSLALWAGAALRRRARDRGTMEGE